MRRAYLIFLSSLLLFVPALAQTNPDDAENCKDSPIIARMPGSKINSCENKEYNSSRFSSSRMQTAMQLRKRLKGNFTPGTTPLVRA